MLRMVFVVLVGLAALGNAAPASAQEIFCAVTGAKQGKFTGDPGFGAYQIPVLFLTQEIARPFDAASGFPTGALTHKPLVIVKELDVSSIQFFQAATTNESLNSVKCTFYRSSFRNGGAGGGGARGRGYFMIALTNAHIVDYKNSGDGLDGTALGDERERISLTYEKIELTDLDNNTTAENFWSFGAG